MSYIEQEGVTWCPNVTTTVGRAWKPNAADHTPPSLSPCPDGRVVSGGNGEKGCCCCCWRESVLQPWNPEMKWGAESAASVLLKGAAREKEPDVTAAGAPPGLSRAFTLSPCYVNESGLFVFYFRPNLNFRNDAAASHAPFTLKGHTRTTGNIWCILTSLTEISEHDTIRAHADVSSFRFQKEQIRFWNNSWVSSPDAASLKPFSTVRSVKVKRRGYMNTDHFQQGSTVSHIKNKLIGRINKTQMLWNPHSSISSQMRQKHGHTTVQKCRKSRFMLLTGNFVHLWGGICWIFFF